MGQTYTGAGNPQSIPMVGTGGFPCTGGPTTSVANVPLTGTIGPDHFIDNVTINLTHTWDSDIEADLISPDGTIWDLTSDNGGAGDNYTNTVFQDGAPSITTGTPPFTGTFQAEQGPFAVGFAGDNVNGNWTLSICDDAGGDSGTLLSFQITFGQPCAITPPPAITVNNDPGVCGANVTLPLATGPTCTDPITNDFNAGGADASGLYPVGTTTVTYTSGQSTATVDVTVVDAEAPTLEGCLSDMTITLDPGDCEAIVNFDVTGTDNCPLVGPAVSFTQNTDLSVGSISNSVACPGGGYQTLAAYNLPNLGLSGDVLMTGIDFGVFQTFGAPTVTANLYTIASIPALPTPLNYGDMTLIATGSTVLPAGGASIQSIDFDVPVVVGGGNVVIELTTPSQFANGFIPGYNSVPLIEGTTYLASNFCNVPQPTPVSSIIGGLNDQWIVQLNGNAPLEPTQTAGPASGTPLAAGTTTTFTFELTDGAGNVGTCSWDITVEEYPFPTSSLVCNMAGGQVSLDDDCEAIIGADDVLEGGPYGCYDDYIVELFYDQAMTQPIPTSPVVTASEIGLTIYAMVTDPDNGNNCWGRLLVEDKIIPALECSEYSCSLY